MIAELSPKDLEALESLHVQGQRATILNLLAAETGIALNDPDLVHLYALVVAHMGRIKEALDLLHEALRHNPSNAKYLSDLGVLLQFDGQALEAFDAFEKAVVTGAGNEAGNEAARQGLLESYEPITRFVRELHAQGRFKQADAIVVRLQQHFSGRAEVAYLSAVGALAHANWGEAKRGMPDCEPGVAARLTHYIAACDQQITGPLDVPEGELAEAGFFGQTAAILAGLLAPADTDYLRCQFLCVEGYSPDWLSVWLSAKNEDEVMQAARHLYAWLRAEASDSLTLRAAQDAGIVFNPSPGNMLREQKIDLLRVFIARSNQSFSVDAAMCALLATGAFDAMSADEHKRLAKIGLGFVGRGAGYHQLKFQPPSDREALFSRRKTSVIIGSTCISHALLFVLRSSPEFRRYFSVQSYITHQHHQHGRDFDIPQSLIDDASVVIHLAPGWVEWGSENSYRQMLGLFSSNVLKISFPYPVFQPLWPFHCEDPRRHQQHVFLKQANDGHPPHLPYGDSYLLDLMRRSDRIEEVVEQYVNADFAQLTDLDGLLARTLRELEGREAETDIKIAQYIAEHFRQVQLFQSVNHVTNAFIVHVANQILNRLELPPVSEDMLGRSLELISGPWPPIHPSVARHFGVTYAMDDARYCIDDKRKANLAEYVRFYARFTAYADLGHDTRSIN